MNREWRIQRLVAATALAVAIAAAGCAREQAEEPVPEVQSEALQQTDRPVTVSGCLKAGDAENTFVLTAAQSDGVGETATYHLLGAANQHLREHVGQRVQVSGTLQARQTAASQTLATPAETRDNERPAATTGTPTVQTRTDVMINQLSVDSVKPLGEECGM